MRKETVRLRRLGWAGVEIECEGYTLLIDYIQDTSPLIQLRSAEEPFPPSSQPGAAMAALLTHLHADHADPGALAVALRNGAPVFRPEAATGSPADLALTSHAESQFIKHPLAQEVLDIWQERRVGPFTILSAPAIDGFGDPQLSWMVVCAGKRIFHSGDTIFHGFWWRMAQRLGAPDLAFLPINGTVVDFPLLQPASPLEAVMTPEQAAVAANILRAQCVVPIHYGSLHKPPAYTETAQPVKRLDDQLKIWGIRMEERLPGDWFHLD